MARLLLLLVQNEGKALSKEYLYEAVWKQPLCGDDQPIRNNMSKLRKKLETANCGYDIVTNRGEGYALITD